MGPCEGNVDWVDRVGLEELGVKSGGDGLVVVSSGDTQSHGQCIGLADRVVPADCVANGCLLEMLDGAG